MKDFDNWNKEKKKINDFNSNKDYKVREIWWCQMGVNIGFEQDGTGRQNSRPVLIIRGFSKQVCLIVPLTSSIKNNQFRLSIGKINQRPAVALISQIRLIDTKRLIRKICYLSKPIFEEIKKSTRDLIQ